MRASLQDIISFCKRRGFVYPCSEIYGGLANSFDYGPYGTELLMNLKKIWWKDFVHSRADIVGLDSSILLHPQTWRSSGHVASFHDPLCDCRQCKVRIRFDSYAEKNLNIDCSEKNLKELQEIFLQHTADMICPHCQAKNSFTKPRQFNLMFSTQSDVMSEDANDPELADKDKIYLRPETAQGIFLNFKNLIDTCRLQVPFGIAQIGKSFRNEIIARQFIFRTREFEQLEIEFFCKPNTQKKWFAYWQEKYMDWFQKIGIPAEHLKIHRHSAKERSFYSEDTVDFLYDYPFGWSELFGLASRTDYDLSVHHKKSKKNLTYYDVTTKEHYLPYVIEPSLGLNRLFLAILSSALDLSDSKHTILKLDPAIAPVQVGIFPLQRKAPLIEKSENIFKQLQKHFTTELDTIGSIGKRYYRQDELGTPYCITIDYETLQDQSVTIRFRDTALQERISETKIIDYLQKRILA